MAGIEKNMSESKNRSGLFDLSAEFPVDYWTPDLCRIGHTVRIGFYRPVGFGLAERECETFHQIMAFSSIRSDAGAVCDSTRGPHYFSI